LLWPGFERGVGKMEIHGSAILAQSKFSFFTTLATGRFWSENVPECHRGRRKR
jgi:hypothetical protein